MDDQSTGLARGKAAMRKFVETHGGVVTTTISDKTTLLCCGKLPGAGKVTAAAKRGIRAVTLTGLKQIITGTSPTDAETPELEEFSRGYGGNALRLSHSDEDTLRTQMASAGKRLGAVDDA